MKASILTLSILCGSTAFGTTVSYGTDALERMGKTLDIDRAIGKTSVCDTMLVMTFRKSPVRVDISGGKVRHIGYHIFSDAQRRSMPYGPVFDFLERYSLDADLPGPRVKSVSKMLAEDNITCSAVGFDRLRAMGRDTALSLSVADMNGRLYRVEWSKEGATQFYVQFPIDYDLLHGTSMTENELRLMADLQEWEDNALPELPTPSRKQLLPIFRKNYYILPGESYLLDNLTSNLYYRVEPPDSVYVPICSSDYPLESMANLLVSGGIGNSLTIDIRIDGYNALPSISMPLNALLGYFRRHGCTPYFGVADFTGQIATCYLVMRNAAEGYCHLMRVTADVGEINSDGGTVAGRLTAYIPMSRVASLFDD